jgi:uncharacterized membrane protein YraQ (UPF0718 family)
MSFSEVFKAKKPLLLTMLLIALITAVFWGGSRYPSLENKSTMGSDTRLEDPLSFEVLLDLQEDFSTPKRIVYSTINWVNTNQKGMAFGVLIGAAFLTLFGQLRKKSVSSTFGNTVIGVLMGAPLGVCVNCAAPVAKGMHDAGSRLETTLTTMFSSPMLNIVVLTMTFSMFPLYMASLKVGATLVFLFVVVPILCRYVFREEVQATIEGKMCELVPLQSLELEEQSWQSSIRWLVTTYLKNLWYIVKITVPLMLLAGFLGSGVATMFPLENFSGSEFSLWNLVIIAMLGVFLPVPIAFDVVLASTLLAIGIPAAYVMALLFTLGAYSIYPMIIVWRSISPKVAITTYLVVAALGISVALIANYYHEAQLQEAMRIFETELLRE